MLEKLPLKIRYGLISDPVQKELGHLAKDSLLSADAFGEEMDVLIEEIFVSKISKAKIQQHILAKKIVPSGKVDFLIERIGQVILLVKKVGEEKYGQYFEKLAVIPALNKYPSLANQEITNWYLADGSGEETVSPTVKAWIDDYVRTKGAQGHTDLERSDYLFNAKNTKGLKPEERRKLATVLASYDRERPLEIYLAGESPELYFDNISEDEKDWAVRPQTGVPRPQPGRSLEMEPMVSAPRPGNQPKFVSARENFQFKTEKEPIEKQADGSTIKIEASQKADFEKIEQEKVGDDRKRFDDRLAAISPSVRFSSGIRPSVNLVDLKRER